MVHQLNCAPASIVCELSIGITIRNKSNLNTILTLIRIRSASNIRNLMACHNTSLNNGIPSIIRSGSLCDTIVLDRWSKHPVIQNCILLLIYRSCQQIS